MTSNLSKKVANTLKRIAEMHGGILSPADVVEEARQESSPLHGYFEWNDEKASEAYRLWQARSLIAKVKVTFVPRDNPDAKVKVRMWASLPSDRGCGESCGYRSVAHIMSMEDLRKQLLDQAFSELAAFTAKYQVLTELSAVFEAAEKAAKKHKRTVKSTKDK